MGRQLFALVFLTMMCAWALWGCDDEPAAGASCVYNSDCAADQICASGACQAECQESRDCAAGMTCVRGACQTRDDEDAGDAATDATGDSTDDVGEDASDADTIAELPDISGPRPGGVGGLVGLVHFRLFDDTILPVAQPVVYWAYPEDPPEPLADGASCDCGYPESAVTGGVDGQFVLEDIPAGWVWLIIQKGNFRKRTLIYVEPDDTILVPTDATEMPVRNDPANGQEVPHIVVGTGRYDAIEDIFAKLRMGPITPTFGFDYEEYMEDPDAWGVDLMLYQQPREMEDNELELVAPSFPELLNDGEAMRDYHVIFSPCAEYNTYGTLMTSAAVRDNVRGFVNEGGKLYVTDYAYDVLEQAFPAYIDFSAADDGDGNADGHIGEPSYMGEAAISTLMYESENRALDGFLGSWLIALDATADGDVLTVGNWVNLNGVDPVTQCCDSEGEDFEVTAQVVMSGPNGVDPMIGNFGPSHDSWEAAEEDSANYPHTVRFPFGCGNVMYSTYHTVDFQARQASLAPQELVLLWLILEINECTEGAIKYPDE